VKQGFDGLVVNLAVATRISGPQDIGRRPMHNINAEACFTRMIIALCDAGLQEKKHQDRQTGGDLWYV